MKGAWRWILLAVGAVALTVLVVRAGPGRVAQVLLEAGPWLPLVLALEVTWVFGSDIAALRIFTRRLPGAPPLAVIARATQVSYALATLAPAGRATGEVARGAVLSRHIGAPAAAVTGAHVHAATLLGNAGFCCLIGIAVVARLGLSATLTHFVLGSVLIVGAFGFAVLVLARNVHFRRWIRGRAARFGIAPSPEAELERTPAAGMPTQGIPALGTFAAAVLAFLVGRTLQCVQFGVALLAVSGQTSVAEALVAHGVHLVASNMGDLVPGQVGVTETSYTAFASDLGLGAHPERALSIPLLIRACQLTVATVCMLTTATRAPPTPALPAPKR